MRRSVTKVDHTAEIAALRQKLAALAVAEADKNNAFKPFTSWSTCGHHELSIVS
jgi:hypothetical protein